MFKPYHALIVLAVSLIGGERRREEKNLIERKSWFMILLKGE